MMLKKLFIALVVIVVLIVVSWFLIFLCDGPIITIKAIERQPDRFPFGLFIVYHYPQGTRRVVFHVDQTVGYACEPIAYVITRPLGEILRQI